MAYENANVVKTLYLPVPYDQLTLDEYKSKYGIDLKSFLKIGEDTIDIDFGNNIVYLVNPEFKSIGASEVEKPVAVELTTYEFETTDATCIVYVGIAKEMGLLLIIDKDKEFLPENIIVAFYEE